MKAQSPRESSSLFSSRSNSFTSCHFISEDPYALHLYQNAQCTYSSHAGMSCYFYCKALDISDRFGVWECILYLMNMFHNHGVDHLNIANILLLSYYFQIKRIENRENKNFDNDCSENHKQQVSECECLGNKELLKKTLETSKSENLSSMNLIGESSIDFISPNSLPDYQNLHAQTETYFSPKLSKATIWSKFLSDPILPKFLQKTKTLHFFSLGNKLSNIFLNIENFFLREKNIKPKDLNTYRSWVPLRSLDDSRLIRTLFVSCWLAFTWIEDIKIPLTRWCDLLRIVPLSEEEQLHINQIGFQQTFFDEVITFWKDLGCFLDVTQNELDDAYLKMLGLGDASYPFTPYLNYKAS